jgi:hypothetical protein
MGLCSPQLHKPRAHLATATLFHSLPLPMPCNTSSETKAQIITLKQLGYSNQAIANHLGNVSHTTVGQIVNLYSDGRPFDQKTPCSGRPHKLTPSDVWFAALALAHYKPHNAANIQCTYFPMFPSPHSGTTWYNLVYTHIITVESLCSSGSSKKPDLGGHAQDYCGHNNSGTT